MNEVAKLELDHQVILYQFYVATYTKGIALFLAITGALLKFALDSAEHRSIFATAGIVCSVAILIVFFYGLAYRRATQVEFTRLAEAAGTKPISTKPFAALTATAGAFWVVVLAGWVYVLLWLA